MNGIEFALLAMQLAAGAALFWSSFCRLTHVSHETLPDIRLVVWVQSVSALTVIFTPLLPIVEPVCDWPPLTTPLWVWVGVIVSAAAIQIVTARHWVDGVPRDYTKPEHRPMRRAGEMKKTLS